MALTWSCATGGRITFPWPLENRPQSHLPLGESVEALGPPYTLRASRAMIRRITRPTLANLDLAAYTANVILLNAGGEHPPADRQVVVDRATLFGGVVETGSLVSSLDRTPLTPKERGRPMAFSPTVDYLARWSSERASGLDKARAAVKEETWGLSKRPGTYYQQIATLYIHRPDKGGLQLWVEIELEASANLFAEMPDADGDGLVEIYGRLKPIQALSEVVARLEQDYLSRVLSTAEVHRWANELASYWYPSYNTDVVLLGAARTWPLPATEAEIRDSFTDQPVKDPTMVIRGKPGGKTLYNVFIIPGITPLSARIANGKQSDSPGDALKAFPINARPGDLSEAIEEELRKRGGSWKAWLTRVAPLQREIRRQLKRRPAELKALVGRAGFLFYRRSLDYLVGGDIQQQVPGKNPFAAIVGFRNHLSRLGVDFLLVPVPAKPEVFPDRLAGEQPGPGALPLINPMGRKFLLELSRAGVEVVDLLPRFLAARRARRPGLEPLYQKQDTHWTARGLGLAASLIAARIKRYPWYAALPRSATRFTVKRRTFKRFGDLHSRLTPREQRRYEPATLAGEQVLVKDGSLYDDDPASPVVILGDSFTGVYQRTDCRGAGVSAHIAREIGAPVDLVMSYGGGPNVRKKLFTRGELALKKKRLLIWLFAARDFHDYWEDWDPAVTPKRSRGGRER